MTAAEGFVPVFRSGTVFLLLSGYSIADTGRFFNAQKARNRQVKIGQKREYVSIYCRGGYQPPGTEINHNVKRLGEFV